MDIDEQAREAATTERQQTAHRESAMDARARYETQQAFEEDEGIAEAVRESATSYRQADEALQDTMRRRAQEEQGKR
jgi:hypothetical protein